MEAPCYAISHGIASPHDRVASGELPIGVAREIRLL